MLSDRTKVQLAKANYRRQFTGPSLTSGTLTAGKFYRITQFKSGDDFRNVGAAFVLRCGVTGSGHVSGQIFEATGTTPTVWTNGSKVQELKVAELRVKAADMFGEVAGAQIAITGGSFEGGQGQGVLTFETSIHIAALEQLLAEFDPDYISEGNALPRRPSFIRAYV